MQFCLSLHSLIAQSLQVSQRGKISVPFKSFPRNEHSSAYGSVPLYSQVCVRRGFQSPQRTLHLQIFPWSFLVSFLLFPTSITALGICIINQFLIVFHNHLKNKAEERIWLFAQIKYWIWLNRDKPWQWSFLGNCHAGQIETVFQLRLLVSFKLILFLQGLPDYWFSQRVWLQSFGFKDDVDLARGNWEKGKLKHHDIL